MKKLQSGTCPACGDESGQVNCVSESDLKDMCATVKFQCNVQSCGEVWEEIWALVYDHHIE